MKAIMLAGGKSSRLKSFTENKPKCLLEVNNKPILQYQLEALIENNITDIVIVIGYKGFMVKDFIDSNFPSLNVTYIENDDYAITGTAYGWWLARNQIRDEESIIHLNADLVFFPELLKRVLNHKGKNVVCIDRKIKLDDSMEQAVISDYDVMLFMDKANVSDAKGKAVGIAKLSKDAVNFMIEKIQRRISLDFKNDHFYGMIRLAIRSYLFHGLTIGSSFFSEVNTIDDYKRTTSITPTKTFIIMLYGLPAAGKTTISRKLRDYFEAEVNTKLISTFRIREEMGLTDLYSKEQREKVYQQLLILLEEKLKKNVNKCIILDGNFNKQNRRKKIYQLVKKYNTDIYVIKCIVNDKSIIKERMEGRKKQTGILEHKASSIDLYDMIEEEIDPIESDEEQPTILTINTETQTFSMNKGKIKIQKIIWEGILNAIS